MHPETAPGDTLQMGFRPPGPLATPQGVDTMTAPPPPELPPHAASDLPMDRIPTSSGLPRKQGLRKVN